VESSLGITPSPQALNFLTGSHSDGYPLVSFDWPANYPGMSAEGSKLTATWSVDWTWRTD